MSLMKRGQSLNKMKKSISLIITSFALVACGTNTSSTLSSSSQNNSSSSLAPVTVDRYVSDVASTAPFMVSGVDGENKVDYVVSSYPVIFNAMNNANKKTNLSIYASVAGEFSKKYSTEGFPQAGLFIKSELYDKYVQNDETIKANVDSFFASYDRAVTDLVNGGDEAVKALNAYSSNVEEQATRFGFNANVIKNVQKENYLSFIEHSKNPDAEGLKKFSAPLKISIEASDLATSLYDPSKSFTSTEEFESLPFAITCPKGAPAASFAQYAADEKLDITSPDNVKAAFSKKTSDFIVFDAVNGVKLSKANANAYKLVRMVTFGNLYLVATGNDTDNTLTDDDYVVSYGEGLVPDLAFKAVYNA